MLTNPYYNRMSLIVGWNQGAMGLKHVFWDFKGNFHFQRVIYSGGWFKENEDLGYIIKEHRAMKLTVDALEKENKANKQK